MLTLFFKETRFRSVVNGSDTIDDDHATEKMCNLLIHIKL